MQKVKRVKTLQNGFSSAEANDDAFKKRMVSDLIRITHAWSPEYIPMNHPFMSCSMVGPGAMFVQNGEYSEQGQEVMELVLSHCSKYWYLGQAMLSRCSRRPWRPLDLS
jgi:hypothetical protein